MLTCYDEYYFKSRHGPNSHQIIVSTETPQRQNAKDEKPTSWWCGCATSKYEVL